MSIDAADPSAGRPRRFPALVVVAAVASGIAFAPVPYPDHGSGIASAVAPSIADGPALLRGPARLARARAATRRTRARGEVGTNGRVRREASAAPREMAAPRRTAAANGVARVRRNGGNHGSDLATHRALDLFGRRWALRVLWELAGGPLRFTEIQARCDAMSPSVLNQRLSDLGGAGVIEVRRDRRYGLTPGGEDLARTLRPIEGWARRWAKSNGRVRA